MKRESFALTTLVCATLVAAVLANQQQDQNLLLGEWKVVSGSHSGQPMPQAWLPSIVLKVEKDGRWSDTGGAAATWATDETRKPMTLDLDYTAGRDRGKKQLCVYEVSGDRLTIAFGVPGGKEADRPNGLSTTPDNANIVVFTFERIKKAPNPALHPR